jgi:hypothetical protein
MQLGLQVPESEFKSIEKKLSARALASVNSMYTRLRRLSVFRLLSLGIGVTDYNEIMELPMLSPRKCTASPDVLSISLPSPRSASSQSIPDIMETFFKEWGELIVHTKKSGPFHQKGEEEEIEVEAGGGRKEVKEFWNFVSPVAVNDDNVIAYLNAAAGKGTRSIAFN